MTANDSGFGFAEFARRLRQTDLSAHETRPLGRESDLQFGLAGKRAQTTGDRPFERFGRRFFCRRFDFDVGSHHSSPLRAGEVNQVSATFTDDSGSSTPKQR